MSGYSETPSIHDDYGINWTGRWSTWYIRFGCTPSTYHLTLVVSSIHFVAYNSERVFQSNDFHIRSDLVVIAVRQIFFIFSLQRFLCRCTFIYVCWWTDIPIYVDVPYLLLLLCLSRMAIKFVDIESMTITNHFPLKIHEYHNKNVYNLWF